MNEFSEEEKKKWKKVLSDESLSGTDWKYRTAQACKMNMIVHGDGNTGVLQADGFKNIKGVIEEEKYDICVTNPPFGAKETDSQVLNNFELGSGRNSQTREILAIERCINLVKKGSGIVALILPDGILNGDRNSFVREFIHREAQIIGVIGFNKETFEGYNTAVKTSVVFLKRKDIPSEILPEKIFMAVCTNTGYSTLGNQIAGNQLPDILFDFRNYLKKDKFEPIHKNSKLVTLDNISERIDAERYIDYMVLPIIDDIEKVKTNSVNNFKFINNVGDNIVKNIIKNNFTAEYKANDFKYYRFSELFEPISNAHILENEQTYSQLGLHGKGRGLFEREKNYGHEIGANRLNFVEKDWLIYSRLFAKNGSFAIVYDEFADSTVSNEFPTFQLTKPLYQKEDFLEYIVFYLISPQAINYIIRLTTGSTKESRGRFKENQLMELLIPIPKNKEVFEQICKPIIERRNYIRKINKVVASLDEISMSLQLSLPNLGEI